VLSSSLDRTFRLWFILSGQSVKVLILGSTVASFSLSGDWTLLVTSHNNQQGIYLWKKIFPWNHLQLRNYPRNEKIKLSKSELQKKLQLECGLCDEANDSNDSNDIVGGTKKYLGNYTQKDVIGLLKPIVPEFLTLSLEPSFCQGSNYFRSKTSLKHKVT
jgi:hypothetical protein